MVDLVPLVTLLNVDLVLSGKTWLSRRGELGRLVLDEGHQCASM